MTTPDKPWWQLFMEDIASEAVRPGFAGHLGLRPDSWERGRCTLRWTPPDWTRTNGGWVQGGFLGVALDMAQTISAFSAIDDELLPQTLEMKVSFIEAPTAEQYLVTGRTVRTGRTAGHTEGDIRDTGGRLIATSTATVVIRPSPR